MDCKNARLLLEFIHPGSAELDAAEAEALHQHLAECPDCAAQAREERRADEHLGRAVRDVPVPAGLRERVLKRLTVERDALYRRLLVRVVAAVAAAAAVLIAGWLGYTWWFGQLPAINGNDVYATANRRAFATASEVERGFREDLGVTMKAPPQFNYQLLDSYNLIQFQGHQVPELLFHFRGDQENRAALARVYVLSSRQFDLEATRKNGVTFPSGTHTVKLEDHPDDRNYLYVVVYTGQSLSPFFQTFRRG